HCPRLGVGLSRPPSPVAAAGSGAALFSRLSHGCAGWPCGRLHALRLPTDLLQFLSRPALSQVSRCGARRLATGPSGTAVTCPLFPRRLHLAGSLASAGAPQSSTALRSALSSRCPKLAHAGGRSEAARSPGGLHGHPAHLGTKPVVPSASAL